MTVVILDGPSMGQRALFTDGELKWESEPGGIFTNYKEQIWKTAHEEKSRHKGLVEIEKGTDKA